MKMWSPVTSLLALMLCIYSIFFIYKIDDENQRQFAEQRLRYAVDYATEAGFRASLSTDNIGIDYEDLTDVKVSPSDALTTFESLICLNYDMGLDDETLSYVESFIPTAILVANDGYYVAKITESDAKTADGYTGGAYSLKWGLKHPFAVQTNSSELSMTYVAFSIKGKALYEIARSGDTITQKNLVDDTNAQDKYKNNWDTALLADKLNKEVNLAIRQRNNTFTYIEGNTQLFHIPSDFSAVSNNAIKAPSLVVLMQNVPFAGYSNLESISVGGAKITEKRTVVGFTVPEGPLTTKYGLHSGINYYCWSSDLPDDLLGCSTLYFSNIEEAAKAGYYPALTLLSNTLN